MTIYVDQSAVLAGDGSREMPFTCIGDAARIAGPGDEVLVAPGVYRECVVPKRGGTKEAPIVYRAMEKGTVIITGSEKLNRWEKVGDGVYKAEVDNRRFGGYNPYDTFVCGDWYFAGKLRHTGCVVYKDQMMFEVKDLLELEIGDFDHAAWDREAAKRQWCCVVEGDKTILYARFGEDNPDTEDVEIFVRRNCFMPEENELNYITVSGFVIKNAATTWAPPAAYQDGAIGPHWAKGWVIEDCEVYNSRCCGISLGKYRDPENDMYFFTRQVKSPTQMERDAVCRGQYHGWLKERIGHHTIRRCRIHHCEQTGIVGRMGAVFSTIEDCEIHHICTSSQLGGAETAGIKLHAGIDVTIRRNHIHHNIMGVWLDWEAQGARITGNFMHDNQRPDGALWKDGSMFTNDIFVEVGHGPTLIDNNILLSDVSLVMPSEGIACVHNLMAGAFSLINSGVDSVINGQREPRYTPYHIRHRTEVAGFMTILHGDDRILNNIFVQLHPVKKERKPSDADYTTVGTQAFDIFPSYEEWSSHIDLKKDPDMGKLASWHFSHLPVWIGGNVYANTTDISKHDKAYTKLKDVHIVLEETEEGYFLSTNLYGLLKDFTTDLVTTDTLGQAFEPEQRFENPDGTPIVFDRDYAGAHRGMAILPGPFAKGEERLAVWKKLQKDSHIGKNAYGE